ncbi:MAG: hypothetical protein ACKVOB_11685 [Sphingomonas sp.]
MAHEPMYGMNADQERRFFRYSDQLRSLGYWIASEPLEGQIDGWLDGIMDSILRINERLAGCQKAYRVRGRSKAARYYLTSASYFDPGFGIHLTQEQREDNKAYRAKLDRGVAKWNAAFGSEAHV